MNAAADQAALKHPPSGSSVSPVYYHGGHHEEEKNVCRHGFHRFPGLRSISNRARRGAARGFKQGRFRRGHRADISEILLSVSRANAAERESSSRLASLGSCEGNPSRQSLRKHTL